ncbi:CD209 antigen-like protein C [Pelmatolapia mariae]|uniref:CD209 antigen-like protein C n=1 Tax=Pelmatolapia mariae TaxID=158779 RepID=UPI002FE5F43D
MSSDIYAEPDLSKKVRYSRKEDGAEWEQREVDIYESTDVIRDTYDHFQSQEGDMTDNMTQLEKRYEKLSENHKQQQAELQDTKRHNSQLQSSYDKLSKNHSQLQEEVKKLKEKIEEKCPDRWTRFGSSCYFKSTETKTWSESRKHCKTRGADLVMIDSKEEQEFINEFGGYSWIGLSTKQTPGGSKWEWVDGSALRETFWANGPRDPWSDDNAVYCSYDGTWRQYTISFSMIFMCEK